MELLLSDEPFVELLLQLESMGPVVTLMQRGSAEARMHAMSILAEAP
jgi:hypothetical protein